MKIKEIIEELKKYDENLDVIFESTFVGRSDINILQGPWDTDTDNHPDYIKKCIVLEYHEKD